MSRLGRRARFLQIAACTLLFGACGSDEGDLAPADAGTDTRSSAGTGGGAESGSAGQSGGQSGSAAHSGSSGQSGAGGQSGSSGSSTDSGSSGADAGDGDSEGRDSGTAGRDGGQCEAIPACSNDAATCPPGFNCAGTQCCRPYFGCLECTCDSQCPSARPFCSGGLCGECRINSDCPADKPCCVTVFDGAVRVCKARTGDGRCLP
jgi:hypothetical protein